MRKKYIAKEKGDDRKFWEDNWNRTDIEDAVKFCDISPLRPVFDTYLPKYGKILEGGCGVGQFVIYYRRKGYDMEGIDFAEDAVARTSKLYKDVPIKKGDVLNLDYPDNYFKAYYSGGVVEHFENGPLTALKEAHRVLNKDGMLIISVPYFNLLRRIRSFMDVGFLNRKYSDIFLDFDGIPAVYSLRHIHEIEAPVSERFIFHQYEYTKKEFANILNAAGFKITHVRPVSISWGLMEFSLLRRLFKRATADIGRCNKFSQENNPHRNANNKFKFILRNILKRIIISEDSDIPAIKTLIKILGYFSANLILFVCEVEK